MDTPKSSSFWRTALANAVGGVIGGAVCAIGAAVYEYTKTRQMTAALLTALSIFLLTLGACLLLWWGYRTIRRINSEYLPQPNKTTSPAVQRLTIRIVEGYFGKWNNQTSELVLLHVKVDGPAATLKDWELTLERPDGGAKRAWGVSPNTTVFFEQWTSLTSMRWVHLIEETLNANPVSIGIDLEPDPKPFHGTETRRAEPLMPELVPDHGWLLFHVTDAGERFRELIFGAHFILTVTEVDGQSKSTCDQLAGAWLHRAVIEFT